MRPDSPADVGQDRNRCGQRSTQSIVDQPFGFATSRLAYVQDVPGWGPPLHRWAIPAILGPVNVAVQFPVEQVNQDEVVLALAVAPAFAADRTAVLAIRVVVAVTPELAPARRAAQRHIVECHGFPSACGPVDLRSVSVKEALTPQDAREGDFRRRKRSFSTPTESTDFEGVSARIR